MNPNRVKHVFGRKIWTYHHDLSDLPIHPQLIFIVPIICAPSKAMVTQRGVWPQIPLRPGVTGDEIDRVREPFWSLEATVQFFSKRQWCFKGFSWSVPLFLYILYVWKSWTKSTVCRLFHILSHFILFPNHTCRWSVDNPSKKIRSIKKISMISYSTIYRWLFHIIPYYQRLFQFIDYSIDGNFIRFFLESPFII